MPWATITAIVGIVILEIVAICNGVNGTAFSLAIFTIGALGGYTLKWKRSR